MPNYSGQLLRYALITGRFSGQINEIGHVRPFVFHSILNQTSFDVDFLLCMGRDHSLPRLTISWLGDKECIWPANTE